MLWDICCRVVDNYGDAGVCWRLCAGLAARGEQVRLWIDDPSPLAWMAPDGASGVAVTPWNAHTQWPTPGDVVVEAFGCGLAPEFIASFPALERCAGRFPLWIDLQYLSAEPFVERSHGLPSPVSSGPGAGRTRHYFFPGFTRSTGGLLREPELAEQRARFDRTSWLQAHGVDARGARIVSLFCYEPLPLAELLLQLAAFSQPTRLLVTAGRSSAAVTAALGELDASRARWNVGRRLTVTHLPLMTQADYDRLLWACDANFVRGEDSWIRAIWAGKPFVWQPYPQVDGAHRAKLDAFLSVAQAPPGWRDFHRAWSDGGALPPFMPGAWSGAAAALGQALSAQDDLVARLLAFASEKR